MSPLIKGALSSFGLEICQKIIKVITDEKKYYHNILLFITE